MAVYTSRNPLLLILILAIDVTYLVYLQTTHAKWGEKKKQGRLINEGRKRKGPKKGRKKRKIEIIKNTPHSLLQGQMLNLYLIYQLARDGLCLLNIIGSRN